MWIFEPLDLQQVLEHVWRQVLDLIWNAHLLRVFYLYQVTKAHEFHILDFIFSCIELYHYVFCPQIRVHCSNG